MTPEYTILDWDSEVFGFPVAKIIPEKLDTEKLGGILSDLKKSNVSLAYWAFDKGYANSQIAAESMHGFLTGIKIIYVADLAVISPAFISPAIHLKKYTGNGTNTDLINMTLQGAISSRFHIDPKITRKQYEYIHKIWIDNSIKNNTIFVVEEDDRFIGFVSLNEKNKRGNIDFIVVERSLCGRGFGRTLMQNAHRWFISRGFKTVQAVTQKENMTACRMYEKFGYQIEKEEYFYHFWL